MRGTLRKGVTTTLLFLFFWFCIHLQTVRRAESNPLPFKKEKASNKDNLSGARVPEGAAPTSVKLEDVLSVIALAESQAPTPSEITTASSENAIEPAEPTRLSAVEIASVEKTAFETPQSENPSPEEPLSEQPIVPGDKIVVIGKLAREDTSWVAQELPDWQNAIYVVDDENATLHTPANKGKEGMAYLTYLVDNYDKLPTTIASIHSHKDGYPQAWHTDNEFYSNVWSLENLQVSFVQRNGYANLRCTHIPGCPDEIQLNRHEEWHTSENAMAEVWHHFFPNTTAPGVIGTACCAQFAVSAEQVWKRPLTDCLKFRTWLLQTEFNDELSGRVLEYLWHIIFGQQAVYCPALSQCFHDVYGVDIEVVEKQG